MSKRWVAEVQEDTNGEAFIQFTPEMLKEVGWQEGDTLRWVDNGNGSFTIEKIVSKENQWVLVETVSLFRHRYVVEVPSGKKDWALDTVTMGQAKEFSQQHIGEDIVSHRTISYEEAKQLCDQDNPTFNDWSDTKKTEVFFTKIEEYSE